MCENSRDTSIIASHLQQSHIGCEIFCARVPLRQQPVMGKVSRLVDIFVVVSILGLDRVRCQQHSRLWGTVVLIVQDGLLHLAEREEVKELTNGTYLILF